MCIFCTYLTNITFQLLGVHCSTVSLALDQAWFAGAWLASVVTTTLSDDVGPKRGRPHIIVVCFVASTGAVK